MQNFNFLERSQKSIYTRQILTSIRFHSLSGSSIVLLAIIFPCSSDYRIFNVFIFHCAHMWLFILPLPSSLFFFFLFFPLELFLYCYINHYSHNNFLHFITMNVIGVRA